MFLFYFFLRKCIGRKKSFETKVSSVGIFHDNVFKINLTIYAPKFFLCSVIFLGCATFLVTPLMKTSVRLRLASWQGENGNKIPLLYERSWNGYNNHQNWSNSFFSAFRSLVAFNFTFKSGCLKVWLATLWNIRTRFCIAFNFCISPLLSPLIYQNCHQFLTHGRTI